MLFTLAILLATGPALTHGPCPAQVSALGRAAPESGGRPHLEVLGPEGYEFVDELEEHSGADLFVLPLVSRSDRVARAAPTRRGVGLRLFGGGAGLSGLERITLAAIRHPADSRVLIVDGIPVLVGPPTLPPYVLAEHGDLAFLARHDGETVTGGRLTIALPEAGGAVLFLIAGEVDDGRGSWQITAGDARHSLPARPRRALALQVTHPRVEGELELQLGEAPVDQAFFAALHPSPRAAWVPLALREARIGDGRLVGPRRRGGRGPDRPLVEPAERLRALDVGAHGSLPELARELAPSALLELFFEAPARLPEGETWTLLCEVARRVRIATPAPARTTRAASPVIRGARHGFLRDVSRAAGIDMVHFEGPDELLDIRPTMGPGAAWGDIDGDGWVDLYLVQGGGRKGSLPLPNRMFRNRGDGTFEDVTERANTGDTGAGMGALFFDADGDGDLDLFVANYGADVLYANDGTGRFTDVSEAAGVGGDRWSAGVCAADYDGDGDLDLYVTSYLRYDLALVPPLDELGRYRREDPIPMLPFAFPGERNAFLVNEAASGPGFARRFVDRAESLGLIDEEGRGMQAVFWDFDRDGDEDLYVANDVSFNALFRNEGDGTFKDISFATGLDDPRGGMGLAIGDVDGDGDEDLFLTNWQLEANALYLNDLISPFDTKHRRSAFHDGTVRSGLGPAGIGVTSWGAALFDADNDGDLDLFVANGYTSPDYEGTGICVGQPNHFFENHGQGRFEDASAEAGSALAVELASRGAIGCDYDRDGRVDLVVTANNGRVQLLHNERAQVGHWLAVRLRGAGGNTFGIGAEVTVTSGERLWRSSLRAGMGYLTGNPPELHFGLGDTGADAALSVEVRWPSGRVTHHGPLGPDRFLTLREE